MLSSQQGWRRPKRKQIGAFPAFLLGLFAIGLSPALAAETACDPAKVTRVQVQYSAADVLVHISGQGWRKIGNATDADIDAKLSIVMTAMASGWNVVFVYNEADAPSCSYTSTVHVPLPVKIRVIG